jgi:hypothetical protein
MKTRLLASALLVLSLAGAAHAGGSTALGGGLGGAAGAAIGEAVGGREGAIIGGALGGGVGAAAGYDNERDNRRARDDVRYEERRYYYEDGRRDRGSDFCPPGQAKKGRC